MPGMWIVQAQAEVENWIISHIPSNSPRSSHSITYINAGLFGWLWRKSQIHFRALPVDFFFLLTLTANAGDMSWHISYVLCISILLEMWFIARFFFILKKQTSKYKCRDSLFEVKLVCNFVFYLAGISAFAA